MNQGDHITQVRDLVASLNSLPSRKKEFEYLKDVGIRTINVFDMF